MTLEEIDRRMYELGRTLAKTHDKKIIKELYELALEREKIDKKSWDKNERDFFNP
jgi:hypothetical protein